MRHSLSVCAACVGLAGLFSSHIAHAQAVAPPNLINFQGRLATPSGNPVPDGNYNLRFRFYDALTNGTLLYEYNAFNAAIKNGIAAVKIDGFTADKFNTDTWIAISINGGAELVPRTQIVSVPYALKSTLALTVPDGSITNAKIAAGTLTADRFASGTLNPLVWLLGGNSEVTSGFLGTTDNNPLELRVNNRRAMRYQYVENTTNSDYEHRSINVLGGSEINTFSAGVVGATIAGGGFDSFTDTDAPNSVTASFGSIGGGQGNTASGYSSTIGGGGSNTASNFYSTVGGGFVNTASGSLSTISGGYTNMASGYSSTIGGGEDNTASGYSATIGGGFNNMASGYSATIGGGANNTASNFYSTVGGGYINMASNFYSTVGGGFVNTASDINSTVGGGANNTAGGYSSSVGGGEGNTASRNYSIVAGGRDNVTTGDYSTIGGGLSNRAAGAYSTIVGGSSNSANGAVSMAAGGRAQAIHDGTFVWNNSGNYFASTGANQFLISSSGGVGINTNAPSGYALYVNGSVAGVGNYNNVSDRRYKQHIETFPNALNAILDLRGVIFDWKQSEYPNMNFSKSKQVGFIAQEVEKVFPELVTTDANGYKAVAYANIVPVAVEAIKTLNARSVIQQKQIDAKDAKIAVLETKLDAALKRLDAIERQGTERRGDGLPRPAMR